MVPFGSSVTAQNLGDEIRRAIPGIIIKEIGRQRQNQASQPQRAAPSTAPSAPAEVATTRDERRQVQAALNHLGFSVGVEDGIFGRGTRGGLRKWQSAYGHRATGRLNAAQLSELLGVYQSAFAAPVAAPEPTPVVPVQPTPTTIVAAPSQPESGQGGFVVAPPEPKNVVVAAPSAAETKLPAYLEFGSYNCWGVTTTPDQASCTQLINDLLVANNCGYAPDPADDPQKARIRVEVSMKHCFNANFNSRVNKRPIVDAIRVFRENKRAALTAPVLAETTQTRTFSISGQTFDVPTAHQREVVGSGVYGYSSRLNIWSNLQPLTPCPSPTAYIIVQHTGPDGFHQWKYSNGVELDLVRTISKTVRQDNASACAGERNYEIIVHGFHDEDYIGTTIVPADEIRFDDYGTGADFIYANFVPIIGQYARGQ